MTTRRINCRGIIFRDGQILGQQLTLDRNGKVRDYWCTPGGGLDKGESLYEGLHREMVEETGVAPKIGKLLFIQQFFEASKDQEQLEFFFLIENPEDYTAIDLTQTSHGLLETTNVEFIDPKSHNLLPDFLQTIDIQSYIDQTLRVLVINEL